MEQVKNSITKLNNSNYFNWKFKLQMLMQREDTWEVIEQDEPQPTTTTWRKKENMARATIGLLVEDSQLVIIRNCATAREMWTKLKDTHQHSNLSNKLYLLRKLYSSRYLEGSSMREHLDQITDLVDKLDALGEKVKTNNVAAVMLCSLPPKFDALITTIEAKDEKELTIEFIKNKLIDEAARREESSGVMDESCEALRAISQRNQPGGQQRTCYKCRQTGHISRDCHYGAGYGSREPNNRYNRYETNRNNYTPNYSPLHGSSTHGFLCKDSQIDPEDVTASNEEEEIAFTGNINEWDNNMWLIDSGASRHMCGGKSNFKSFNEYDKPIKIKLADGENIMAYGAGIVHIKVRQGGKDINIKINDVLWVPQLTQNLLSVKQICNQGWIVNFKKNECNITKGMGVDIKPILHGAAYIIQNYNKTENEIINQANICLHDWHEKLGHKSMTIIKRMAEKSDDLKITKCNERCWTICEPCKLGGTVQKKFESNNELYIKKPFQVITADICGPIKPVSIGGNKYFLTVTDRFSKFTFVSPLKSKDQTNNEMKKIIMLGHNKHGHFPEVVRTDGGGEFVNDCMKNFYEANGILHQRCVPHTPEQNGVSERKNRTVIETIRKMLCHSKLDKSLWGEALMTSAYIYNLMADSQSLLTPYELWEGRIPNYNILRTFGEVAYYFVPKVKRDKLGESACRGRFVGYSGQHKGYRIWNEKTRKIIVSRSVDFSPIPKAYDQKISHDSDMESLMPVPTDEEAELEPETYVPMLRRSARENLGHPPKRLSY